MFPRCCKSGRFLYSLGTIKVRSVPIIFQTLQYLKKGQSRMCDEGIFVYCYVIWYSDRRQLLSSIQQDALNLSQRPLIGHIYSPPVSTSAKSYQISHYY